MKSQVVVLGGSGMLGSMIVDVLRREPGLTVVATTRSQTLLDRCRSRFPGVDWHLLDVLDTSLDNICSIVGKARWVINAIGLTKPYINDSNAAEVERAVSVNSLFPHRLGRAAAENGTKVLQIATDCVYSGSKGRYVETDPHDAIDVYGKTKSLGEAPISNLHCLRCSVVGPEPKTYSFLLEWLKRQPTGATVQGYKNHMWNGITTLHFARLCHGIVAHEVDLPHIHHVVPGNNVSKAALLYSFASNFELEVKITPVEAKTRLNRTLQTLNGAFNNKLWSLAGYDRPPSVPEMVAELAKFDYAMEKL